MKNSILAVLLLFTSSMAMAQNYVDAGGREWRKLNASPLLQVSASTLASVCSQDPCRGSINGFDLTGWTWANANQVLTLMREFEPAAPGWFYTLNNAQRFQNAMGVNYYFAGSYVTTSSSSGLTSSIDPANGNPIQASVAQYSNGMNDASFSLAAGVPGAQSGRTVFLYRRAGSGPPVVTPPPPPPPPAPVYKNCIVSGRTVLHGASIRTFQASSVRYGSSCVSQTRVCNNGVLSGTYTALTCTVEDRTFNRGFQA